jgi:phosphoglycerol transferase MdoB-like AlkP superfamily enzyme
MKRIFTNRLILSTLVLFIITFIGELYIRVLVENPILNFGTLRIFLSSLFISLTWSYIFHFFNVIVQRVANIIYTLVITILLFTEACLYKSIGFFMGLGNAEQGGKVTDYIRDVLISLPKSYYVIFLLTILGIVYFIFFEKKILNMKQGKKVKKLNKIQTIYLKVIPVVIILILIGFHYITIRSNKFQSKMQIDPTYAVWLYPKNANLSVNNFGVLMYLYSDTKNMIMKVSEDDIAYLYNFDDVDTTPKKEDVAVDYRREIDDSAWKELDKNTTDQTYKTLNNYFMNRSISQKNDMTGIFKGKNVIIMLLESVNDIAILNENDFPTLHKMYNEGISFRNNFSPRNNCSTGNNEMTVNTSLFTINDNCTANVYTNNVYPEAYLSMFRDLGYDTSAYHDYTQQYYYRARYFPKWGANKFYGVDDLGMSWNPVYQEWPSDKTMFESAKSKYMNNRPFAVYFAGVTTHRTYDVPSEFGDKYTYLWDNKNYPITTKRYLSKMKELDDALAELLKELEDEGILDDTVIALFGDHYPYGLKDADINAYLTDNNASYTVNSNSTADHNVDRTPLIIYNSSLEEGIKVEDYTTIIDLLPTLFNMFDVNYDPRLYLGTDIFSKLHESRAYFVDGSWQDENASYYAPSSRITYVPGKKQYSAQELKNINLEIVQRQSMSASAIRSNYFNYLGEGLKKYSYLNTTTTTTEIQKEEE